MSTTDPTNAADLEALGLTNVLAGSLPTTLGTTSSPETYQVDAVFSRRPLPEEVVAIHSAQTQETLATAGYPAVTLRVSDRRLEIHSTSLEQLEMGLATVLADHLAALTSQVAASQAATRKLIADAAEAEGTRADGIAARAELVRFRRSDTAS